MSKYVIKFEDNPWYQDDMVGYYKCSEIPWWSAKKSDIKKLTPLDKELEEAYQKGLHDGKARNENGCVGCKYDNGRIDHSPCDYCCNAYSNQWMAKENSDEIKVGDGVRNTLGLMNNAVGYFIEPTNNEYYRVLRHVDGKIDIVAWHRENCVRTGGHSYAVERMVAAMKEGAE